jgi:diaminohydroxyphosphoribosylaminopyrimidine deaminase/5-amino-6-(5-phosphoribosylamino)uracil reductase
MREALRLARRGYGQTSPNPMVGAVLVKAGTIIGRGWHRRAGKPHAEIEALRDAEQQGANARGATLYVTLEPCCTHGRTPPCTEAIIDAGIERVVIGAVDPNPAHAGSGLKILKKAGLNVIWGVLDEETTRLNEAFNHWIVHRTPFVTVKSAMTLDGKIGTVTGESKWITSDAARAVSMKLRQGADALLVGVNTILADDPSLTVRLAQRSTLRRIVLDTQARTPLASKVVRDKHANLTTIIVGSKAPPRRVTALRRKVSVVSAPLRDGGIDLRWLLKKLGGENVTSLLVEGGGEVNAGFLLNGLAQRTAFFYAPKVIGGFDARKAVAGAGVASVKDAVRLRDLEWRRVDSDLFVTARLA